MFHVEAEILGFRGKKEETGKVEVAEVLTGCGVTIKCRDMRIHNPGLTAKPRPKDLRDVCPECKTWLEEHRPEFLRRYGPEEPRLMLVSDVEVWPSFVRLKLKTP